MTRSRTIISVVASLALGPLTAGPALGALSASPNPSSTGSYTVSDASPPTLPADVSNAFFDRSYYYNLVETPPSGSAQSYDLGRGPVSQAFTGKAAGSYTYQLQTCVYTYQETEPEPIETTVCTDRGSSLTVTVTSAPVNTAPVAEAGTDQTVNKRASVSLDGSGSSDADNDTLTYSWSQTSGTDVTLSGATTSSPSFTAPASTGALVFSLKVNDGKVDSAADSVTVTVTNTAPVANAGTNKFVTEGRPVTLNGSGTDVDKDPLTYVWKQDSGTDVALGSTAAAALSFTAPELLATETLVFSLKVNDGTVDSAADTVTVRVIANNDRPTANAGPDQEVDAGDTVTLSGSGTDPERQPLRYSWSQSSGTAVTLSSTTAASPTFTAPSTAGRLVFSLTVNDGVNDSLSSDSVTITVREVPPPNRAPVANAGTDQTVNKRASVSLDGSSSSDADNDVLKYSWSQTSGTDVTLSGATTSIPSFTAPANTGALVFSLTVNDGKVNSAADSVTVTVTNTAPVANAGTNQSVTQGGSVTLNGSGTDVDRDPLTYTWRQDSGTTVTLSSTAAASPSFTAPASAGTLVFSLTVNDGTVDSTADTVTVTVTSNALTASPNPSRDGNYTVSGSLSTVRTYESYRLEESGSASGTYTVPDLGNISRSFTAKPAGTYTYQAQGCRTYPRSRLRLRCFDIGTGVTVTVVPSAPTGFTASPNPSTTGDYTLSWNASTGATSYALETFRNSAWTAVTLAAPSDTSKAFTNRFDGSYDYRVKACIGTACSTPSGTVTVSVDTNPTNSDPVADAGTDRTGARAVTEGDPVTLDGTGSSDPDTGDTLTYAWTKTSGPDVTLMKANEATASFNAPELRGNADLVFTLTVSDNHGAKDTDTVTVRVLADDDPPTAEAGQNQSVGTGVTVTLVGSGADPEGQPLTYAWTKTSGPDVTLTDADKATASFTAPSSTATLVFELSVSDGVNTATDRVTVTVSGPTAQLSADPNPSTTGSYTVSGSATKAAYHDWVQLVETLPGGTKSIHAVSNPSNISLTFSAKPVGTYAYQAQGCLVVDYGSTPTNYCEDLGASLSVSVIAPDEEPPTAEAGPNRTVDEDTTVTLTGSATRGTGTGPLRYAWKRTLGPDVQLSSKTVAGPTFTAPNRTANYTLEFQLVVSDSAGDSDPDTVTITVRADNDAPTAEAGQNQSVGTGAPVTLTGSGTDPEGQTLTFTWRQIPSSTVTLTGDDPKIQSFTAPSSAATLQFELSVSDGVNTPVTDRVTVTVSSNTLTASPNPSPNGNYTVTGSISTRLTLQKHHVRESGSASRTYPVSDLGNISLSFTSKPAGAYTYQTQGCRVNPRPRSPEICTDIGGSVKVIVIPATPTGFSASPKRSSTGDYTLSWNASAGATRYALESYENNAWSAVVLNSPTNTTKAFTNQTDGSYDYRLKACIDTACSAPTATLTVTVGNTPPVAEAGKNRIAPPGAAVTLDGSDSHDDDGDNLTYAWRKVSGPVVTLANANTVSPSFTAPSAASVLVFELVVNDGTEDSIPDRVTLTVNTRPVAEAGNNFSVAPGASVTLDGSGSADADGDSLQYRWTPPSTAPAGWSGANGANPTFTAPALPIGQTSLALEFRLVVNDSKEDSAPDTVTVTVTLDPMPEFQTPVPDQTWRVDEAIAPVTVPAATGGDAPLEYSVAGLPANVTMDTGTLVISGTPGMSGMGAATVTVRDADADSDTLSFDWTVVARPSGSLKADPNPSPDGNYAVKGSVSSNHGYTTIQLFETGPGATTASHAVADPAAISQTFTARPAGAYTYRIRGCDLQWRGSGEDYNLEEVCVNIGDVLGVTVLKVPPPLFRTTVPEQTWRQNATISPVTVPAATGGKGELRYGDSGLPNGLTMSADRVISGTPGMSGMGTTTVTATDVDNGVGTLSFKWTVTPDDAPPPPTNVRTRVTKPTNRGDVRYAVFWGRSTGATRYEWQLQAHDERGNIAADAWGTASTTGRTIFTDTVTTGGDFSVRVRACKGEAATASCSAWTSATAFTVALPPPAPGALVAPATSADGAYTVSWPRSPGAKSYRLEEQVGTQWSSVYTGALRSQDLSAKSPGVYRYRAQACNDHGCSAWNAVHTVTVTPPGGLSVDVNPSTDGNYTVSWTKVTAANTYRLFERAVGARTWLRAAETAQTSHRVTGKPAGQYNYRVESCVEEPRPGGQGTVTACAPTGWAVLTVDVTPPPKPGPITGPATSNDGNYTLAWVRPDTTFTLVYEIEERRRGEQTATTHRETSATKAFTGQAAGTYEHRVRACSGTACSAWTETHAVTVAETLTADPNPSLDGDFEVRWTAVHGAETYRLRERAGSGGQWAELDIASATRRAFTGKSAGEYRYTLDLCVWQPPTSDWACHASGRPTLLVNVQPPPPAGPIAVSGSSAMGAYTSTDGDYTLTWNASAGAARYELEEQANGVGAPKTLEQTATTRAFTNQPAGTYAYRVRACAGTACSAWSDAFTVTVSGDLSAAPDSNNAGQFTLNWTAASGAHLYRLYQSIDDGSSWTQILETRQLSHSPTSASPGKYTYRVDSCVREQRPPSQGNPQTVIQCRTTDWPRPSVRIADAGTNRTAHPGETVSLDGSASRLTGDGAISYRWTQSAGTAVTLSDAAVANPEFTAPRVPDGASTHEDLVFSLTVEDGSSLAISGAVTVTVNNRAPVAEAGKPQTVRPGDTVTLDGSASADPDPGDTLRYAWTQSRPAQTDPEVQLNDTDNPARRTFTAPALPQGQTRLELTFRLVVDDRKEDSPADTVTVTVTSELPPPPAGLKVSGSDAVGEFVSLDGAFTLTWEASDTAFEVVYALEEDVGNSDNWMTLEPTDANTTRTISRPTPGTYRYRVRACLKAHPSLCSGLAGTIAVRVNEKPVASAGMKQTVDEEATVMLDGSGSSDDGHGMLSYAWSYAWSAINGSTAGPSVDLDDLASATPSFTAPNLPATRDVVFTLVVTDEQNVASDPATVTVTVRADNDAPTANAGQNQSVYTGDTVTLDGTASHDPENQALEYQWSVPTEIADQFTEASLKGGALEFTAPAVPMGQGSLALEITLVVSDGVNDSDAAGVTVTVTGNPPPPPPGPITGPQRSTDGAYTLQWGASTAMAAVVYELHEKIGDGKFDRLDPIGTMRMRMFSDMDPGTYAYRVRACLSANRERCSDWTDAHTVQVVPPGALHATPNPSGTGAYTVSWPALAGVPVMRLLERANGGAWNTAVLTADTSHRFSGKAAGKYTYRLEVCLKPPFDTDDVCEDVGWNEVMVEVKYESATALVTDTVPGNVPYDAGVTKGGDAYINIPIVPVPGVNGLEPILSIDYSGGRDRTRMASSLPLDTLGYGWQVSGFSTIRRCVKNRPDATAVQLTSADTLCLDGEPLVLVSGDNLQPNAQYRTLRESFHRIVVKGTSGAPWFEVTTPDGAVKQYGNTDDSRLHSLSFRTDSRGVQSTRRGTFYMWSINRHTDAFGNTMAYEYAEDALTGVRHPLKIVYGHDGDAEITFQYVPRTDSQTVYMGTVPQNQLLRLQAVLVALDDAAVRRYRFKSETVSGREQLSRIQVCRPVTPGTDECLAPMAVAWEQPAEAVPNLAAAVSTFTDAMGNVTAFTYKTLNASGPHDFQFSEPVFGPTREPANVEALPALPIPDGQTAPDNGGAVKTVVTTVSRSNGIGGRHETHYAYLGHGFMSTRNWGYLGFYATRETDAASGVVTYYQYRLDYPYFGEVAAIRQYHGQFAQGKAPLFHLEMNFASETLTHGNSEQTVLPYVNRTTERHYEGATLLGATQSDTVLTMPGGYLTRAREAVNVGHTIVATADPTVWGAWATPPVTDVQRKTVSTATLENLTGAGRWLIGFPSKTEVAHHGGSNGAAARTDVVRFTRHNIAGTPTNRVARSERLPDDMKYRLQTDYTYNGNGLLEQTAVSGANVQTRTTRVVGATPTVAEYVDGRYPKKVRNPLDQDESFGYDVRFGLPSSFSDVNGRKTTIVYDGFGRETRRTTPDGVAIVTQYEWCAKVACPATVGGVRPVMRIQITRTVGPTERQYLDSLGRVLRTETQSFSGAAYYKEDVTYDDHGRVKSVSQPYSSGTAPTTVYTYDKRDRIDEVARPDKGTTEVDYAADGHRVKVTVTEKVKLADGITSGPTLLKENHYNLLGELVKTVDGAGASTAEAATDKVTTTYTYDASGLPDKVTVWKDGDTSVPATRANSITTDFDHDVAGNRSRVEHSDRGTVTFEYTALGELRKRIETAGATTRTTTFGYDKLGRPIERRDPDGLAQWGYDPVNGKGMLGTRCYFEGAGATAATPACAGQPAFKERFAYHPEARLKEQTTEIRAGGLGLKTYVHRYAYDTYGRLRTVTYPSGTTVRSDYNAQGYPSSLTDTAYSPNVALETYRGMNAYGQVTETLYGNGVTTTREFDRDSGRLEGIDTKRGTAVYQDNDYKWQSNGILQSRISHRGRKDARTETFSYDPLNRLKSAVSVVKTATPTLTRTLSSRYDRLGNITGRSSSLSADTAVTYTYGTGTGTDPSLTTLKSANIDGVTHTLHYDDFGQVKLDDNSATSDDRHLGWNARRLPTTVTVGKRLTDPEPVARDEFAYGPDGARYYRKSTWRAEGTNGMGATYPVEHTFYAGRFKEVIRAGDPETRSVQTSQVSAGVLHVRTEPVSGAVTSTFEYLHRDHLGSVESVTGSIAGNAVEELQWLAYDPFGQRRNNDWSGELDGADRTALNDAPARRSARGYTGHEHLERTGLVHMNGRVYDPVLGRFLSPDPVVADATYSQSWNPYSYALNSPLSFTDPSGLIVRPSGGRMGGCPPNICLNHHSGPSSGGGGSGVGGIAVNTTYKEVHDERVWQRRTLIIPTGASPVAVGGNIDGPARNVPGIRLVHYDSLREVRYTERYTDIRIQQIPGEPGPVDEPMGAERLMGQLGGGTYADRYSQLGFARGVISGSWSVFVGAFRVIRSAARTTGIMGPDERSQSMLETVLVAEGLKLYARDRRFRRFINAQIGETFLSIEPTPYNMGRLVGRFATAYFLRPVGVSAVIGDAAYAVEISIEKETNRMAQEIVRAILLGH